MERVQSWPRRVVVTFFLSLIFWLSLLSPSGAWAHEDYSATEEGREKIFDALVDTFKENYWNPEYIDWDLWADQYRDAALGAPTRSAFDRVARQMIFSLNDEHSSWVGLVNYVEDPEALPEEAASLGLGILHEYLPGSGVVIRRVYAGTPAEAAGLHRGDLVVSINGGSVTNLSNTLELNRHFSSAIATRLVTLQVRRSIELMTLELTPQPLHFSEVQKRPVGEMIDAATGYVYLPSFNAPHVADDVHEIIADLQTQGAGSLILDLRGNLGGRLSELGLVLGAFIEGPWAQAVSRGEIAWESVYYIEGKRGYNVLATVDEPVAEQTLENPVHFFGPLVVLVDRRNSSAGEVAALVLQEMGRATVIGEPTGGNVEAVRGFDLPDGSLVMVAVANLQGPTGNPFDGGVVPDIEASESLQELARGYDAPVAEALGVLKALPFTPGKFF